MGNFEARANQPSIEVPGFPGVDLAVLTPDEVVAVLDLVGDVEDDQFSLPDTPEIGQQIALNGAIWTSLKGLPEIDSNFGRETYTALSESADWLNRSMVGSYMESLTRVDHDYGLMLWDRLVRDENRNTRDEACTEKLREGLEGLTRFARETTVEKLGAMGLTVLDGIDLLRAYEYAREGHNLYAIGDRARREQHAPEVGAAALQKLLVNLTNAPGS